MVGCLCAVESCGLGGLELGFLWSSVSAIPSIIQFTWHENDNPLLAQNHDKKEPAP